jgi:hypothetical protein
MPRPRPEKITVEFDDGSKSAVSFDDLPVPLQFEIERQPVFTKPSSKPEEERFVLLEWEDGWKEVIQVDEGCTDVNRYYIISRPEDVGRLSLNKKDGYPQLIQIIRRPTSVKQITFLDTFQLNPDKSTREGKKTEHFFSLTKKGDALSELVKDFKNAVAEKGLDIQELRSQDPDQLWEPFEAIRRDMGIQAGQRQQDVYDFLAYLTKIA